MESKVFMIIDDDRDDIFFFKEAISQINKDAICIEAENGESGLNLLHNLEHLPDYLFLDINMPCINGYDCLAEIKKDEKLKRIPVIIYSTAFSKQLVVDFTRLGASFCLKKPADLNELPSQIKSAIDLVHHVESPPFF